MEKHERLLVRGASQILTIRGQSGPRRGPALGELAIVENGAILIEDGSIRHVGPAHRIENLDQSHGAREVDARGGVVLPGFVDSHTHLVRPGPRPGEAPEELDKSTARSPSAGRLKSHARAFLGWMAAHGTTTAEMKCFSFGDEIVQTRELRTIQSLDNSPIHLVPTVFASASARSNCNGPPGAHAEWCARVLLPLVVRRKLAAFVDVQCGCDGYSLSDARMIMEAALSLGLGLRAHASSGDCASMVRIAVGMGAASVDHLDGVGPACVQMLAESRTIATLIPGVAFQANLPTHPPARALIDSGAAVALATGFDGRDSASCSMPMVLSLACNSLGFSAAEAIAAATINAAHALLCADGTGSLEVGKQADFIVASVRDYRDLPYYFGVQTISRVFRRGVEITPERN